MEIPKDFNFWAIVAYLIPGLLIVQARSLAARTQLTPITKDSLVGFAIVTVFYSLVLWYFGYALQTASSISSLETGALVRFFVLVPLALGFCFAALERYGVVQWLLLRLGINAPLPIETVWLEIFAKMPVGTYLIVILKDGRTYNAMVTRDSRFSSNREGNDLYLGQTYSLKTWKPSKPQRDVYIRGSEIQSIEIIARP